MDDKGRVIMLVSILEQPRIIKRIIQKASQYGTVDVLAYTRGLYEAGNYEKLNNYSNIKVIKVGSLVDSSYLSRPFLYLKLYFLILFKYGFTRKNIYVFSLDLRIFCSFLINAVITYEISDIIWLYLSRSFRRVLSAIDFFLAKRSAHVVFTSEGFYKQYFSFLDNTKVAIVENKFKSYSLVFPVQSIIKDRIRIAYIGTYRYKTIIEALINVVSETDNIVLNFYGDGIYEALELIKSSTRSYNNVFYHGKFKNPDDLERIYAANNLNFVAYDNKLENEKVAMPNKFYESGYFNIPIVCSTNTYVGERVKELDMGWVIEPTKSGIDYFIKNLHINDIINCHQRIKNLNKEIFEFDD